MPRLRPLPSLPPARPNRPPHAAALPPASTNTHYFAERRHLEDRRASPLLDVFSASAASCADRIFELIDSPHDPTRVNKCDGMWFACAEAGAIFAYIRAAPSPCSANTGLS